MAPWDLFIFLPPAAFLSLSVACGWALAFQQTFTGRLPSVRQQTKILEFFGFMASKAYCALIWEGVLKQAFHAMIGLTKLCFYQQATNNGKCIEFQGISLVLVHQYFKQNCLPLLHWFWCPMLSRPLIFSAEFSGRNICKLPLGPKVGNRSQCDVLPQDCQQHPSSSSNLQANCSIFTRFFPTNYLV